MSHKDESIRIAQLERRLKEIEDREERIINLFERLSQAVYDHIVREEGERCLRKKR
jgi:hypothetical protein